MSSYGQLFLTALLAFLWEQGKTNAARVTGFEEETERYGVCSTCSYTQTTVEITYVDGGDEWHTYRHEGSFISLIRDLTKEDA